VFHEAVFVEGVLVLFVVGVAGAEAGGTSLKCGAEERAQCCDGCGEDADIQFAGGPDCNVDTIPQEVVEFAVEGEVVYFNNAGNQCAIAITYVSASCLWIKLGAETYKTPNDKMNTRASLTRALILTFHNIPIGSSAKTRSAIMLHAI